ncbi:MAG: type IV pilus biogenesis/stability protein PilW [Gammaproteobacteria bacterium]|nr:type IV pilus biogenesis/stability protein PilW [Gammaproteobacteria bacterium]
MRTFAAVVVIGVVAGLLTGCVTSSTGGLPEAAEPEKRVEAHLDLARGYLTNRDYVRARAPLKRALEIDPRAVEAHVLRAVLSEAEKDPHLAEQHYKTALRYDPDDSQALNNYGSFLYGQGRYTEALTPLRKLVKDHDYRARSQAYENLGLAELKAGDPALAKDAFSRALMLNFAQSRSSLELADIAYVNGEYDEARDYYDGFRVRARQSPRSLCLGMKLGATFGDSDQLASYALALQNLYPNSPEAKQCEVPK